MHPGVTGAMPFYICVISEWELTIQFRQRTKVTLGGGRLAGHLSWGHNFSSSVPKQAAIMCVMSESNTVVSGRSDSNTASLGKDVK